MNKSVKLNLPLGTNSQAESYTKKNSKKKPSQFLYWLFFMLGGVFLFSGLLALWPLKGNAQIEKFNMIMPDDILYSEININDIYETYFFYKGNIITDDFNDYGSNWLKKNNTIKFFGLPFHEDEHGFIWTREFATTTTKYFEENLKKEKTFSFINYAIAQSYLTTAGDGELGTISALSWDIAHDATVADAVSHIGTNQRIDARKRTASAWDIYRLAFPFDTSGLADNVNIATASFFGYTNSIVDENSGHSYVALVETFQESDTSLILSDYQDIGSDNGTAARAKETPIETLSANIDIGDLNAAGYSEIPLNQDGIDLINKTGITYLGIRLGSDLADVPVTARDMVFFSMSEYAGTDHDPYLEITLGEIATPTPPAVAIPCNTENFSDDISIISTCGEVWGNSTTAPEQTTYTYYYSPFLLFFYISIIIWTGLIVILIFLVKVSR